jgi:hypothetical protein
LFSYPGRWTPWTELAKVAAFGDEQALEKRFGSVSALSSRRWKRNRCSNSCTVVPNRKANQILDDDVGQPCAGDYDRRVLIPRGRKAPKKLLAGIRLRRARYKRRRPLTATAYLDHLAPSVSIRAYLSPVAGACMELECLFFTTQEPYFPHCDIDERYRRRESRTYTLGGRGCGKKVIFRPFLQNTCKSLITNNKCEKVKFSKISIRGSVLNTPHRFEFLTPFCLCIYLFSLKTNI